MAFTPRVGVYVCHCGINISATVDVAAVAEYAAHLPGVGNHIAALLEIAPVLVFTGNMIDQPGRTTQRFPAELEAEV